MNKIILDHFEEMSTYSKLIEKENKTLFDHFI